MQSRRLLRLAFCSVLLAPGLRIPFYVGGGIGLGGGCAYYCGAFIEPHLVAGLAFELRFLPLDFYAQLEPGIALGSGYLAFVPGGSGGIRWFF